MRLRPATQLYDHALQDRGLTATQYNILAVITHEDDRSMGAIANWLGMDPTTLNRNLLRLLALRLVQEGGDPRDGRVRMLAATKKGQANLRQGLPPWRDAQRQLRAYAASPRRSRRTASTARSPGAGRVDGGAKGKGRRRAGPRIGDDDRIRRSRGARAPRAAHRG